MSTTNTTTEPVTLIGLRDLHDQAQARFREALGLMCGRYEALGQRYDRVSYQKLRPEVEALAADLRGLLAAPAERLRYVAQRGATDARGLDPVMERDRSLQMAFAAQNGMRPKESAVELVRRFAARGIVVRAVDGALRISPADALDEADRAVLFANKAGIIAALALPEVTL